MKKLALLGVLLLCLVLVSCPLDFSHLPSLGVELDKDEVSVGETVKLLATINKAYINNETSLIFYIEDYPKDYEILKGTIYEKLTDEKYLCIIPAPSKGADGIVKVQMCFSEPGEYVLKVNGFASRKIQEVQGAWNEKFYTYKILVK